MNWFQKWFYRWSFIDLPTIGVGLIILFYYINAHSSSGMETALVESIFPNLATELFGVWLSVRIIESVLRTRQKRSQLRSQLVENMNYLVTLIRGIAPHFEQQTIDHLSSELKWFEEMKDYRISGISEKTTGLINDVTKHYSRAATEASKINPLREEINDLFVFNPELLEDINMKELHDVYRRQNYTRIIVKRIDSRLRRYHERSGDDVSERAKTVIRKIEEYSNILKVYVAITLEAESAVLEARSAVLNREFNF